MENKTNNENFLNKMLKKWKEEIEYKKYFLNIYYLEEEALIFFNKENKPIKNLEKNKYNQISNLIKFKKFSIENCEKEINELEKKIKQISICLVKNKN